MNANIIFSFPAILRRGNTSTGKESQQSQPRHLCMLDPSLNRSKYPVQDTVLLEGFRKFPSSSPALEDMCPVDHENAPSDSTANMHLENTPTFESSNPSSTNSGVGDSGADSFRGNDRKSNKKLKKSRDRAGKSPSIPNWPENEFETEDPISRLFPQIRAPQNNPGDYISDQPIGESSRTRDQKSPLSQRARAQAKGRPKEFGELKVGDDKSDRKKPLEKQYNSADVLAMMEGEKYEHQLYIYGYKVATCKDWLEGKCPKDESNCFDSHCKPPLRRKPHLQHGRFNYIPTRCRYLVDKEECPQSIHCRFAHCTEEVIYHPSKFKTQRCSSEAKGGVCEVYGRHCAKAHSDEDLRAPVYETMDNPACVHLTMDEFDDFVCAPEDRSKEREFYMYVYKTRKCEGYPYDCQCDGLDYHRGHERRRGPFIQYLPIACPHVKPSSKAEWKDPYDDSLCTPIAGKSKGVSKALDLDQEEPELWDCQYAHTLMEIMYHPQVYKTDLCQHFDENNPKEWRCVWKKRCAHAHGVADLRGKEQAAGEWKAHLGDIEPPSPPQKSKSSRTQRDGKKKSGSPGGGPSKTSTAQPTTSKGASSSLQYGERHDGQRLQGLPSIFQTDDSTSSHTMKKDFPQYGQSSTSPFYQSSHIAPPPSGSIRATVGTYSDSNRVHHDRKPPPYLPVGWPPSNEYQYPPDMPAQYWYRQQQQQQHYHHMQMEKERQRQQQKRDHKASPWETSGQNSTTSLFGSFYQPSRDEARRDSERIQQQQQAARWVSLFGVTSPTWSPGKRHMQATREHHPARMSPSQEEASAAEGMKSLSLRSPHYSSGANAPVKLPSIFEQPAPSGDSGGRMETSDHAPTTDQVFQRLLVGISDALTCPFAGESDAEKLDTLFSPCSSPSASKFHLLHTPVTTNCCGMSFCRRCTQRYLQYVEGSTPWPLRCAPFKTEKLSPGKDRQAESDTLNQCVCGHKVTREDVSAILKKPALRVLSSVVELVEHHSGGYKQSTDDESWR